MHARTWLSLLALSITAVFWGCGVPPELSEKEQAQSCTPSCEGKCGGSDGCGGTCPTLQELPLTEDTYLRVGQPNKNHGTEKKLWIKASAKQQILLKISQASLQALSQPLPNPIKLRLTITDNGQNWGTAGGTLALYRMTQDWTEVGATKRCANDTDTTNNKADCPTPWSLDKGRKRGKGPHPAYPWHPQATASVLITNASQGTIELDVTTDIQAFLSGTPNYGWILRKTESTSSGEVAFGARESSTPPKLVFSCQGGCTPQCDGKCGGSDGCNGTCPDNCIAPQTCGGGGTPDVCGCTPQCSGKCGGSDGCGGSCPDTCVAPQTCGGGGTPNVCGCTPQCTGKCGGSDSCGGTCPNNCIAPQTCGGSGIPNVCGCAPQCSGKCSGPDGCGGSCSNLCVAPQTCGGGGTPNVCGCTPQCSGKCGGADGCGGSCPNNCVAPQTCGGGGTPNVCGCTPQCTNKCSGADSCGGTCPDNCPTGQTCGGSGVPDLCGIPGCTRDCTGKCGGSDGCGNVCPTDTGETRACYSGPSGTAGVGTCKQGTQTCGTSGWSSCAGEVTPQAEDCDGLDNDCDGSIDEGLQTRTCYSGPSGTAGVGTCKQGTQQCQNSSWTVCAGELAPQPEFCDSLDNDCDGSVDESCTTIPTLVPSPIDRTVASNLYKTTAFLYSGPQAVQSGVIGGTIEPLRVAILRGKVLDRASNPLSGVKITIKDHPEFGYTYSRADGYFDMAVNGGGLLFVKYEKTGLLPLQRRVQTSWRQYSIVDEVVMTPYDTNVTTIDLSASTPIQVARGSTNSDTVGTRRETLFFKQGTTATMTLPGGGQQALTQLSVRATEYTVGPSGPAAMPALLPPTTAYTYAVEYSVDQAIAAGATRVSFSQPVISYNENYYGFPVGQAIPVGYYNRQTGVWEPWDNGRVVQILSIQSGLAVLDLDGSGQPASSSALASLGIDTNELQQLASLYTSGTSLWRVAIGHFSPLDKNPSGRSLAIAGLKVPENRAPEDRTCKKSGSVIQCQNQALQESVSIVGAPFGLHYSSDRVTGRKKDYTITINLSGPSIVSNLLWIELRVQIAGQEFFRVFPAQANQSYTFTWDGKDGYGRFLQGRQRAEIDVAHVYNTTLYTIPDSLQQRSFGLPGIGSAIPPTSNLPNHRVRRRFVAQLGVWNARAQELGGWNFSVHHAYDPNALILLLGNGERRQAPDGRNLKTIAGKLPPPWGPIGGPAIEAYFVPDSIAVDAKDNIYIADWNAKRVYKIDTKGIITTYAGNGVAASTGDGGPATQASINGPKHIILDGQGNLYISEHTGSRIRKVDTNGIITTVAGTGVVGYGGDGGPATQAQLLNPEGLTVDVSGNLYFTDGHRIRRVSPDGIIRTIAGRLTKGFFGDGGPAQQAYLDAPYDLAVDAKGNLYISDWGNNRIRKITPDGIITTIAGSGTRASAGDGGPATLATFTSLRGIEIDQAGNLYIADGFTGYRIRKIDTKGIITTIAGDGTPGYGGNGGPATKAQIFPEDVAVGPDGSLYITDERRIRKITTPYPAFSTQEILIPSAGGSLLYRFNLYGRHLQTINTYTKATVYNFAYDTKGRLSKITDGDGNETTVQRDTNGNLTGVTSPYGQQTLFTHDTNGYIASAKNPANESMGFSYSSEGLLQGSTDAKSRPKAVTVQPVG